MGILKGAKEQIKWGNLKYLGGYPNKTIPFICGFYKESGKIEIHGGAVWNLQFSIPKEDILNLQILNNKILMKIKYENAEIELQFTASNIQQSYNKMTTVIYQDTDTPMLNKTNELKKDNIVDKQIKFYEKTWFMWVCLIFFAPVGVFLLWKYGRYNKNTRIALSIISIIIFISAMSGSKNSSNDSKSASGNKTKQTEVKKEPATMSAEEKALLKKTYVTLTDTEKTQLTAIQEKYNNLDDATKQEVKADYDKLVAEKTNVEERKKKIESQFSAWDGSNVVLTNYIKDNMNDPKSYEHVKTIYWDMKDYLVVQTTFRGKNAFGGVVTNSMKAKISLDGSILEIMQ